MGFNSYGLELCFLFHGISLFSVLCSFFSLGINVRIITLRGEKVYETVC